MDGLPTARPPMLTATPLPLLLLLPPYSTVRTNNSKNYTVATIQPSSTRSLPNYDDSLYAARTVAIDCKLSPPSLVDAREFIAAWHYEAAVTCLPSIH
jgi:hypothetical protein